MDEIKNRREERAQRHQARWEERRWRRGRPSLFFPLILVALGAVFLLRNLGYLSGDIWGVVLSLWPVLVILIGLDNLYQGTGIIGPIFWIGIGVILLLSTLGLLVWGPLEIVLALWPLLLVSIGLDLLFGRRAWWLSAVGVILLAALMGGALLYLGVNTNASLPASTFSQNLQGANQATVQLEPAFVNLHLSALPANSASDVLIKGSSQEARGETLTPSYAVNGNTAVYRLTTSGVNFVSSYGPNWNLELNPSVPVDLKVTAGVGSFDLDLRGLTLSSLEVDMGLGQMTIYLPESGEFPIKINGAIGDTTLVVPAGVEARIQTSNGITATQAPESFTKNDGTYTTPGYATASQRLSVEISQAIGHLAIRQQ